MKVLIKPHDNTGSNSSKLIGQTVEVEESGYSNYYRDVKTNKLYAKNYCELLNDESFEPRSGMVFRTKDGRFGIFVSTDRGLIRLFDAGTYGPLDWKQVGGSSKIIAIYEGANNKAHSITSSFRKPEDLGRQLWPELLTNEVQLNSEYKAIIEDNKVTVGCQTFSLFKVEEILEVAKKLSESKNK